MIGIFLLFIYLNIYEICTVTSKDKKMSQSAYNASNASERAASKNIQVSAKQTENFGQIRRQTIL